MSFNSSASFDPDRIDQIVEALGAMLQRRSIARELERLKSFAIEPERIDELVLAAIDASFCLADERLAAETPRLSIGTPHPPAKAANAA